MNNEREQDRIIHLLLSEKVGGQTYPDLTDRILERAFPPQVVLLPPKPVVRLSDAPPVPRKGPGRKESRVFRFIRPLIGAAAIIAVVLYWMHFNKPYPAPALTGDFTVIGGGPVQRLAEIVTSEHTARLTLGGSYHVDMAPQTRIRIEGAPHAEVVSLLQGEITCDAQNDLGDLKIKTDIGSVIGSDTSFRAALQKQTPTTMEGETILSPRKLVVTVLTGVAFIHGDFGTISMSPGHNAAFAASATAEPTRIAGTLIQNMNESITVQVSTTPVVVAVDANTEFKLNGQPARQGDLFTGMNVIVSIASTGTQVLAVTHASPATTNVAGTLADIADGLLTIKTRSASVPVMISQATEFKLDGKPAALSDLKLGMSVIAITADGKTAAEIRAYTPTPTIPPAHINSGGTR